MDFFRADGIGFQIFLLYLCIKKRNGKRIMSKSISILDRDYLQWVDELIKRYQACQIRAAVKVNAEQLRFN
jgi:hypothetical protein